jgi:hypothetical protein
VRKATAAERQRYVWFHWNREKRAEGDEHDGLGPVILLVAK